MSELHELHQSSGVAVPTSVQQRGFAEDGVVLGALAHRGSSAPF